MGGGCKLLWDCHSGVWKASSRSGLVCLLWELLDLRDRSSGEAVSVLFDFCNNVPWDVAAELSCWGVMQNIIKRFLKGWW